ncbi:FAD-binding oxidoreductase [Microbacterium sp. NPDC057944]|uniref:FAD-binding oxidoreductase n=1 Tax=Microbacterium sp. NPDC057944 TaxID=3346286 RepID=UPI0036DAC5C9
MDAHELRGGVLTDKDPDTTIRDLELALPGRVLRDLSDVRPYSHDRSRHRWAPALAVVLAESTDDVATAVRICGTAGVAVIARGAGTGLEGGANALSVREDMGDRDDTTRSASVVVDLMRMNRVLHVDPDSADATVEAGVRRSELNPALAVHGLQFVAGPGVDASIGGMAATRASGTNAVKHGTMADNVRGLTVVMSDGSVVRTGSRARKSAAGYDLTHLFVGSEGTLGIITELTLRLTPVPAAHELAVYSFPSVRAAALVVQRALHAGIDLGRAELLDTVQIEALNSYSHTDFRAAPTLFVELSGDPHIIVHQAERLEVIMAAQGMLERRRIEGDDPERFWKVRHDALPAAQALRPDSYTWSTDVCVPISHLADCITETQADIDASGLVAPIAGHVGDGNFHLAFVLRNGDDDERERAAALTSRMIRRALAVGGTCTGEHGIGVGKMQDLIEEHPSGIGVMRAIKDALDPRRILNPGKMLDG